MESISKGQLDAMIARFGASNFMVIELTEVINDLENEIADLVEIIDRLEGELAEANAKVQELNEFIEEIPPIAYSRQRYY